MGAYDEAVVVRAPLLLVFVAACAGSPTASPSSGELVVGPVAPPGSAPAASPSSLSATTFVPVKPPPADARSLALRMRDELLASASSQASGPDLQLYQDAADRERADDLAGARKAYYELITQQPSSPLVPYAYLAFGDLFFTEGESGSPDKLPLAKQSYEKVLSYPPPANRAYAYASHRAGVCDLRAGDHARALAASKRAIEATRAYPSLPLAAEVAEQSRKVLVEAYAAAGQPDRALAFFRAVDATTAAAMVVELGERYARRGATRDLVSLYGNALAAGQDAVLCDGARAAVKLLSQAQPSVDPRDVAALEAKRSGACGP